MERIAAALADRYRIERELGVGGMATVYLAEDLKHDRKVAIKVLKPELAALLGADRFVVEIKTTASLQHPHILPLFDSGTADGFLFYVMPYIQGETIREKLNRETQFGVDEAVRIAREVAGALDYAHRHGVIHRDIKPENILLHDGSPMVMDFGIALAVSAAAGGRMTETGLSLGTPHYMSPEQATADKDLTARSDIYSLASVLYEMLAGEPPHTAGSAQAVIMKIVTDQARPVEQLRRNAPPNVSAALLRALEKLPADRFESAKAFGDALANPNFTTVAAKPVGSTTTRSRTVLPTLFYGASGIALAAIAFAAWAWRRPDSPTSMLRTRFTLELPDSQDVRPLIGSRMIAISPDGTEIVYAGISSGRSVLFRRRLDDFRVSEIPGSESPAMPVFGPDGTLAIEGRGRSMKLLQTNGGPPTLVAEDAGQANWGDGDLIVFRRGSSLWRANSKGMTPIPLTTADSSSGGGHSWPYVLPGGKAVLFNIYQQGLPGSPFEVAVVRLADGKVTRLGLAGLGPRYVSSGHVIVARQDGSLLAAPFDLESLEMRGPAMSVAEGILVKPNGTALFDVSRNGVLTYVEGDAFVRPVTVDAAGNETFLDLPPGLYQHPRWSPAGDRIAFERSDANRSDIWVYTRASGQVVRLTRDGRNTSPEWSADGARLGWLYTDSTGSSIRWQRADGSGSPEAIPTPGLIPFTFTFSPNGRYLAVSAGSAFTHDIMLVPLDSSLKQRPIANSAADELQPSISPDGRWLAFTSSETGVAEVYVSSIDDPPTRVQVTSSIATEPMWGADGKTLLVRSQTFVMIDLSLDRGIEVKGRRALAVDPYRRGAADRAMDFNRRSREIVGLARDQTKRERIVVVTGWLEELRQRTSQGTRP